MAAVPEEAWGAPTPCAEWTVRQVLNHARVDQQVYGLTITGGRPDADAFQPSGALDGEPVAEPAKVLDFVADTYTRLPADAESVPTPLDPLPLPLAAAAGAMDAAVRAWDIAVATGQDRPLAPEPAAAVRPVADRLVPYLRATYRVFGPEVEPAEDGDAAASLLAFLGRDPHWARPAAL